MSLTMNRDSSNKEACIFSCVTAVPHDIKTKRIDDITKITKVLFLSNH